MALINCPECGKEISDKALACPNCGNPMNKQPQQPQQEEYLCCPKCGSRELHSEHKGFSGGKAIAGALITGGIGLLAGTFGSKDVQITCLKCGYRFKAGEARVIKNVNSVDASNELEQIIIELTQSSGPLYATKWYKENHECGLKEAKDTVDAIIAKHNIASGVSGNGCSIILLVGISLSLGVMFLI